jgi:hypothetical protein
LIKHIRSYVEVLIAESKLRIIPKLVAPGGVEISRRYIVKQPVRGITRNTQPEAVFAVRIKCSQSIPYEDPVSGIINDVLITAKVMHIFEWINICPS